MWATLVRRSVVKFLDEAGVGFVWVTGAVLVLVGCVGVK